MKKMMLKTSNLLYLFDFDGTLVGTDEWHGYIKNCKLAFKRCHFNPDSKDIRWSILTARPKIDNMLVRCICGYHSMAPERVMTSPTLTYQFKSTEEEAIFKEKKMKGISHIKSYFYYDSKD
jgi:phosphoglycolate phosphatase-like HAD superfamily hydrolase